MGANCRRILLVAAMLQVVVTASCSSEGAAEPESADNREAVAALGRLEPESEILDIGALSGTRLERLLVVEGQRVKVNDELAYLETHDEQRAARDHVAAKLAEARRQRASQERYGTAAVTDAEVRLQEIRELRPVEIEAQRARVRAAEVAVQTTEKELERHRNLMDTGVVSQDKLDDQLLRTRQAEENFSVATAILDEMTKSFELDLRLGESRILLVREESARALAAIPVQSLERSLDLETARLERTIIRAPRDARILKIQTFGGETIKQSILQMGDTSVMHAVAEVYETDIGLVRRGQSATIKSPALPRTLHGKVEQVGIIIFKNDVLDVDPSADQDARVVEVRIRLDESELVAHLTNLQVNVKIEVGPTSPSSR